MDGTNPLIFVGLGLLAKNPALTAIGMYAVVDPPDAEKKEELIGYSNIGQNEESTGYSNIGQNEESTGYSNIGQNEESTGYSNIGQNEESTGYSNIGETQKTDQKKRFVY